MILLLVNMKPINPNTAAFNLDTFSYEKEGDTILFDGSYYDISPGWYAEVGVKFLIAMFADLLVDSVVTWSGLFYKFISKQID